MVSTSRQRPPRSPSLGTDHTRNPPPPQSDPGMNSEHITSGKENTTTLHWGNTGVYLKHASLCHWQEQRWCVNSLQGGTFRGCYKLTPMQVLRGYWLRWWKTISFIILEQGLDSFWERMHFDLVRNERMNKIKTKSITESKGKRQI